MLRIAIVTNQLAPNRTPVFSKIAGTPGIRLHVFSSIEHEPDPLWDYPALAYDSTSMGETCISMRQPYINNNVGIISGLKRFAPDVIVTDGFNPIHVYAFLYALSNGLPHVPMTDGTDISEQKPGFLQRAVRHFVYSKSKAFISASDGGQNLFDSYGLQHKHCFKSCLCVDNDAFFEASRSQEKRFDFIFCGRIEAVTKPLFALEVALQVAKRLNRKVKMLYVGSGAREENVRKAALLYPGLVEVEFAGSAVQRKLPELYSSARVLLFPTVRDPWGVVANEACAAGLPVIVSPYAGVANELVRDGQNGFVCDLDVDVWADKAEYLLTNPAVYQRFSENSRDFVSLYTFKNAAEGVIAACRSAVPADSEVKSREHRSRPRPWPRPRPRVVIVERQLLHYRVAFYNRLRDLLDKDGIELQLLIGDGTAAEKKKKNEASLDWAKRIPTHYLPGTDLCWQPCGAYARNADLVIVMHENKILYNLWLLFVDRPRRIAFWGHGANLQSDRPNGWKERFKRWTINKVDWWFAYTETSAALVTSAGFPGERTTIVENSIDTKEMSEFCRQVTVADCRKIRDDLGLGEGPIGLYLGSLYKEKRLGLLLSAAQRIREKIPGFQLLVVGAGIEQEMIENAARQFDWIHYLGPLQDREKAVVLVLADVILNPGLVGLGILDSFISGTPMFTTDCGLHSPEISYLSSGVNGVMTSNNLDDYVSAVVEALSVPEAIARLSGGALASAPRYTVENMADRIRGGIKSCLALQ